MKKNKPSLEIIKKAGCVCHDCAEKHGTTWPEGHCATIAYDIECGVCKQKKACAAVSDWDWPDPNLSKDREF
jgi:hypothetical protein